MATVLAKASSLCCTLTRVADSEAFSVVGMIRGPAEIDPVPAAGDGQRGRVVPAQRQEQRTLARGTCEDRGNEEESGLRCKHSLGGCMCPGVLLQKEWAYCGAVARELPPRVQERQLVLRGFCEHESPCRHLAPGKSTANKAQLIAASPGFRSRQHAFGSRPDGKPQEHQHSTCILYSVTKLHHCEFRQIPLQCMRAHRSRTSGILGLQGQEVSPPQLTPSQQPTLQFLPGACQIPPLGKIESSKNQIIDIFLSRESMSLRRSFKSSGRL